MWASVWAPVEDPRARRRRSWVFDAAVVVFTLFLSVPDVLRTSVPRGLAVAVVLAMVLPLLVRRIWPVPVFGWAMLVAAGTGWWALHTVSVPMLLVGLYTITVLRPRRVAVAAAVLEAAALIGAVRVDGWGFWVPGITLTALVAASLGLGLYVGTRRAYLAELRDRAARLERERDQQGALAAAAERARIARELHDIVAHHLTVMVALSDGAAAAAGRTPEQAAEVMRTVSATGRQALADTRRLLGVLGADVDRPTGAPGAPAARGPLAPAAPSRHPLPDLSDLDDLLARVRAAGLTVRYEVEGPKPHVPSGVQLTVFRLVQEALTNTMKHAGDGASATVRLHYAPDEVRVEVVDDGEGGRGRPLPTPGRGLTGMRERVAAYGGDVRTGPREPRGWQVAARMRLDETVEL